MDPQLFAQFPEYAALLLAAGGFGWYLKYSRAEREASEERDRVERQTLTEAARAERDEWRQVIAQQHGLWREFLADQQKSWAVQLDRVVAEFRETLREDREESLRELRELSAALASHDQHAQLVAERFASILAGKLVETAKGNAAEKGT